jgi:hypothetical protein
MKNVVRGGLARSAGRKKITNGWFQQQMARGQQFYSSHRHQRTREETWLSNEHLFLSSQINEVPGARPRVERKNRGLPVGTRIVIRCGQFPLNVRPSGSGAVAAAGRVAFDGSSTLFPPTSFSRTPPEVPMWITYGSPTIRELSSWINPAPSARLYPFGWQGASATVVNMKSPNGFEVGATTGVVQVSRGVLHLESVP